MPFEERIKKLKSVFAQSTFPHVNIVSHEKCKSSEHLKKCLEEVEKLGGEGLMLRKPKSKYEGFRSSTLLKVKTFFDAEAQVLAHEPGKGILQHPFFFGDFSSFEF